MSRGEWDIIFDRGIQSPCLSCSNFTYYATNMMCSYVKNFEQGLVQAWGNFLDGKEHDHVVVQEEYDGKKLIGTTESELIARERRRRDRRMYTNTNKEL